MKKTSNFEVVSRSNLKEIKGGGIQSSQAICPFKRCDKLWEWLDCRQPGGPFCVCKNDGFCGFGI